LQMQILVFNCNGSDIVTGVIIMSLEDKMQQNF